MELCQASGAVERVHLNCPKGKEGRKVCVGNMRDGKNPPWSVIWPPQATTCTCTCLWAHAHTRWGVGRITRRKLNQTPPLWKSLPVNLSSGSLGICEPVGISQVRNQIWRIAQSCLCRAGSWRLQLLLSACAQPTVHCLSPLSLGAGGFQTIG